MKKAFLLLTISLLSLFNSIAFSQAILLMKPTGDFIGKYPVMEVLQDTSQVVVQVNEIIENSAVEEILSIYAISQAYMRNMGMTKSIEPAYLALTQNQGGFAKQGFYLVTGEDTIDKRDAYYVDIMLNRLLTNFASLMSFTQLFPHELAHVIYSNISHNDSVDPEYRNVDMHYFPVITDYNTAFNEGFAEQMENVSRIIESNIEIRTGIQRDLDKISEKADRNIKGYVKDFRYPWRLGYFKSSVVYWFQQYEDYRRHTEALDASIKYLFTSPELDNIEDRLSIRNAGLIRSDRIRNRVQATSTEGFVSAFFTHIIKSSLPDQFYGESFYRPFLADTSLQGFAPDNVFSPLQNQFIKYFYVIHNHVSKWNTDRVQLVDFINGYCESFPEEAGEIKSIYLQVAGREFTDDFPPQLWLMVKEHDHRVLAIDPFGAISVPVYTFDLNAAEEEDLLTIKGIDKIDAVRIIQHREEKGLFYGFDEIRNVEGLKESTVELILNSRFDKAYIEALPEAELSFSAIINAPLLSLGKKAGMYAAIMLILLNLLLIPFKDYKVRQRIWINLRYLALLIFIFLLGFAFSAIIPVPLYIIYILLSGIFLLSAIIFIKNRQKFLRSTVMVLFMIIVVFLSII